MLNMCVCHFCSVVLLRTEVHIHFFLVFYFLRERESGVHRCRRWSADPYHGLRSSRLSIRIGCIRSESVLDRLDYVSYYSFVISTFSSLNLFTLWYIQLRNSIFSRWYYWTQMSLSWRYSSCLWWKNRELVKECRKSIKGSPTPLISLPPHTLPQ